MDDKLARGLERQVLRRVDRETIDVIKILETTSAPLHARTYCGQAIRPDDFNSAITDLILTLEDSDAYLGGEYRTMRSSKIARSKDVTGSFNGHALGSMKIGFTRGAGAIEHCNCYVIYRLEMHGQHRQAATTRIAAPFHLYRHALQRYIERSGIDDRDVPAVNEIINPAHDIAMLFHGASTHIHESCREIDVVVPWLKGPGRGAFLGQIVDVSGEAKIGIHQESRRRRTDIEDLFWTHGIAADIQTFYGTSFLTREQDRAMVALDIWYQENLGAVRELARHTLMLPGQELNEQERLLLTDFVGLLLNEGFAELFSYARTQAERHGRKRHVIDRETVEDAARAARKSCHKCQGTADSGRREATAISNVSYGPPQRRGRVRLNVEMARTSTLCHACEEKQKAYIGVSV